jgi:two-component system CheB/CheR fusion protein
MASPREFTIHVVVADDAVRDSLYVLLDSFGFATCPVGSIEEFREEYRPLQKSCLVIDEDLAGISGFELLEELRSEGVRTPAILMTQRLNDPTQAASDRIGAMLLEKPCTPDKLIGCLKKILGRGQS